MVNAILGKNFTIEFYKEEEYKFFGCATDLRFNKALEVKETKTLGDGKNKRVAGQSITRTISLSGVVVDDDSEFTYFDLDNYIEQMVEVAFRIIAEAPDGALKVTYGNALVLSSTIAGGAEGHATGDFEMHINGPIIETDALSICNLVVTGFSTSLFAPGEGGVNRYKVDVGLTGSDPWLRYEYSIDGSGWLVGIGGNETFFYIDIAAGTYDMSVRPNCESGAIGESFTQEETLS